MNTIYRRVACGALVAAAVLTTLTWQSPARAERARLAKTVSSRQAAKSLGGPLYVSSAAKWNICYKRHILGPKCKCCLPPIEMVLQVKEPCGCCLVDVPVCVPGCCTEPPRVSCRRGLFGRHVVTYDWCCGYHLKIVMTKHGDVIVHYFGC